MRTLPCYRDNDFHFLHMVLLACLHCKKNKNADASKNYLTLMRFFPMIMIGIIIFIFISTIRFRVLTIICQGYGDYFNLFTLLSCNVDHTIGMEQDLNIFFSLSFLESARLLLILEIIWGNYDLISSVFINWRIRTSCYAPTCTVLGDQFQLSN